MQQIFFPASLGSSADMEYDEVDATHRGCHKFVPRHDDELFIEIGDPILVQLEADDLWCEGTENDVFELKYWVLIHWGSSQSRKRFSCTLRD